MATTYQGHYQVVVKKGPAGEPIIVFEPFNGKSIPALKNDVFGIHMEFGTSFEDVEEIARAINKHMSSFFLTKFDG